MPVRAAGAYAQFATHSGKSNKLLSILQSTLATEKMCCILSSRSSEEKTIA